MSITQTMLVQSIIVSLISCYTIYRISKFFLVSWQNNTGYVLLLSCISLAMFYDSFVWWVNLSIGVAVFVALYLLLSRLCRLYIRKPIVAHISMIILMYSSIVLYRVIDWNEVHKLIS